MYDQIISCIKQMLLAPALQTFLDAYEADFESNITLNVKNAQGNVGSVLFQDPLTLSTFASVFNYEPPRSPGAPYPCAYVYHLLSEYTDRNQEDDIVVGTHSIGITIIGSGVDPSVAEQVAGRTMAATKKYLETNQYVFGILPRAAGASTLAAFDNVMPGMQIPKVCVSYHALVKVHIKEYRY